MLFVAPRAIWTVVDDWHGVLGLRGSGSNSIRIDQGRIPAHFTQEVSLLDLPVEGGTPDSKLHGNALYAGRAPSFFHGEQRYFRDAATNWTHVGPTMAEPLYRRVGRDRLGLPS
ncbi:MULTISPECIES: hypothetical protein [Streptomyces]|uniref:hypothetical protein n=1 Tax=Streptomyces TaxID=1883 RepID=UPI001F0C9D9C|nr:MULTISPECIES: hypothetical protein [Streptomyces]